MAEIIDDHFMVCDDCLFPIVNDDWTMLDFHYNGRAVDQRRAEIAFGIDNAGGNICLGDSDKEEEFSSSACHCCGNPLAGRRTHMVILG